MAVLGFSCNIAQGRVTVRGVHLEDGVATEVFHHRSAAGEDQALHLRTLANALETRLSDLPVEAVVVRTADHNAAARLDAGTALRLRAEGVVLATARARVAIVECFNGRQVGEHCEEPKADVDARAEAMLDRANTKATAAALAAERLT